MFSEFRQDVKILAKEKKLTYAKIAEQAGVKESSIKCFMCGANDSRRIAEKLVDALGKSLVYTDGKYHLKERRIQNE